MAGWSATSPGMTMTETPRLTDSHPNRDLESARHLLRRGDHLAKMAAFFEQSPGCVS